MGKPYKLNPTLKPLETFEKHESAKPLGPVPGSKPGKADWTPDTVTTAPAPLFKPVINPKPFAG